MALAPFRRERAVKKILLVKALPLRVVLLYRTAGWNARLFRKSLCKRLCKSLKTLSSAGGRPFRRSSGAAGGGEEGPPGTGDIRHDMACALPPPGGGGKRGIRHQMVSYPPLNSPSSSFKPRLPAVARLKARGPQGRLLLQGHTLDGSGAFRSANQAPCTVWPRTVMRGGLRKENSGQ